MFVPKEQPVFTEEQIKALFRMNFQECTAHVLNMLFDTKLTGADIALCIGKRPVRLVDVGQRIIVMECWHNPKRQEEGLIGALARLLRGNGPENAPGDWPAIAIRTALIIACLGELHRAGVFRLGQTVDFAAVSGSFDAVMSGWYARDWGFPIHRILCACNENSGMWELLHNGELRTDAVSVSTATPAADIPVPAGLERLIDSCGGLEEVCRFRNCFQCGKVYRPGEEVLASMRSGLSASVVGTQRARDTQAGVKRSSGYTLSLYDALCYAGIQDFRAGGGGNRPCILLSQYAPEE